MTTFIPVYQHHFPQGTPLQQAIINRTDHGVIKYGSYGSPEITAPLESLSRAVESAFVLVEKTSLPKITTKTRSTHQRTFGFMGDFFTFTATPSITSQQARKNAAKWLSIAAHLEVEEKAKDYEEAKRKAVAEAAAKLARAKELDRIATFHFGKPISELNANKTSAIEEIYRLEQEVKERTPYDERDAA